MADDGGNQGASHQVGGELYLTDLVGLLVSSFLDVRSRCALRLCSKEMRDVVDLATKGLKVSYRSEGPPDARAPKSLADVERTFRGILGRRCKPERLTIALDSTKAGSEANGLAVLGIFSGVTSLTQLSLHGLPLRPTAAARITAAAPGLTSLTLSGATTSCVLLVPGLRALLRAAPMLTDLSLSLDLPWWSEYLDKAPGRDRGPRRSATHPALSPLFEHEPLRRLEVHFLAGDRQWSVPDYIVRAMPSLTKLTELSLVCEGSGMYASPGVYGGGALRGLQSLSLRGFALPPDALRCLATSLPQLRSLSQISAPRHTPGSIGHVSCLTRLTALTSLALSCPLSAESIQQAAAEGAWELPPQLAELHLSNSPLTLPQLVNLVGPPALHSVKLGPAGGLQLPDSPAEAAAGLAELQPLAANWGLTHLALRGCRYAHQWAPRLGPMALRGLWLYDMRLDGPDVWVLSDSLSPCLEELGMMEGCCVCLPHALAVLMLRLHRLRSLTLEGELLSCGDLRHAGGPGGARVERLLDFPRMPREAPGAAAAVEAERGRLEAAVVERMGGNGSMGGVLGAGCWLPVSGDRLVAAFEAALMLLLERGAHVRVVTDPWRVAAISDASSAVLEAVSRGVEWGRLELVERGA